MFTTKYAVENIVLQKVCKFWNLACIPTKYHTNQYSSLSNLVSRYLNLKKKRGPTRALEECIQDLPKLFDIIALDAIGLISKDRFRGKEDKELDIAFLADQRGIRNSSITSMDQIYTK